jgi:hypothetical protein
VDDPISGIGRTYHLRGIVSHDTGTNEAPAQNLHWPEHVQTILFTLLGTMVGSFAIGAGTQVYCFYAPDMTGFARNILACHRRKVAVGMKVNRCVVTPARHVENTIPRPTRPSA